MDTDRSTSSSSPLQHPANVSRAVRLVSVQADCDVEQALILLTTRAAAARISVDELANAVIDGSVGFS